ncbi:DUF7669 domain-containing protein [Blastococcus brunescens]|uniref:DUF7669 domain-containing protein n=1 Tax=Blastococcus brunescens TaxID=1564165 RepID=A0ABZ1B031_9ACTN|nr:hypothetical protein [Blastococcus sp. BMG 8361]WRL62410.1 hypothetical protein U6N30_20620 [Blastococcus sp. BMG 8361]
MIDWPGVWAAVAARVAAHRAAGRGHLLTEDTVRLETVLVLEQFGVAPGRLAAEVPAPELAGGKLDLAVDFPGGAVVELKYPQDSRTGISPDTMTFGELLRDFLRVAAVPAGDRWVVQLLNDRLVRYVASAGVRHGLGWAESVGDTVTLPAAVLSALPATAARAIGTAAVPGTVTATCAVLAPVGDGLSLYAFRVDGLPVGEPVAGPEGSVAPPPDAVGADAAPRGATRDGARVKILAAAHAVVARSGQAAFTMPEVIAEMRRRGTGYADSTIRTMIAAHLCADATGEGVAGYADFTRAGRGQYRFTGTHGRDVGGRS